MVGAVENRDGSHRSNEPKCKFHERFMVSRDYIEGMKLTGGNPFWSVRNGLLNTYPSLDKDVACEVAIIGGGITGALAAFTLVKAGVAAVLIDKRDIGSGST